MAQDRPKMAQKGPKRAPRGPRWAQDGPKMAPRGPKMGPRWPKIGPKRAQDGPKMAQNRAQDGSQIGLESSWNIGAEKEPRRIKESTPFGALLGPLGGPKGPLTAILSSSTDIFSAS